MDPTPAPTAFAAAALKRLQGFDLNRLIVLKTLLDTASVSETARRLDSSQPAVSRLLERLRQELDDPLLVKSSNRMLPTTRAMELQPLLAGVFDLLLAVYRPHERADPATETRTCTIAASDSLQALVAPGVMQQMRRIAPRALVRLMPVPYPNPRQALFNGEADVLLGFSHGDDPMYRDEVVSQTTLSCLCARENPHIGDPAELARVAGQPYLEVSHLGTIAGLSDTLFAAHGLHKRIVAAMSSFIAAPGAIAGSDMVTLVPTHLAPVLSRHPGVRVVPLREASPVQAIRMVWHNASHNDAFLARVRGVIREAVAAPVDTP